MSDNKSGAEKSLGQLAFEAYWGDFRNWDDTEPRIKVQWEIAGGSVRDAVLSRQSAEIERRETQLITERDDAEQALSHAYFLVTGRAPEWSSSWGMPECLEEIEEDCKLLRKSAKSNQAVIDAALSADSPEGEAK